MAYNPVANPMAEPTPRLASFEQEQLQPPAGFRDSGNYRDSYGTPSNASFDSAQPLPGAAAMPYRDEPNTSTHNLNKEDTGYPPSPPMAYNSTASKKKKGFPWVIAGVAGLAIVVVAVVVPIYFTVIKKNNDSASSQSNSGSNSGSNGSNTGTGITNKDGTTGADGSTVTMEDGTTFTYANKFGGFWVSDPDDPYNSNAQAQSWSPPLNQSWDWQNDKIRG
ncbi:hypothetical protein FRB90_005619 [Tulasnella sp. 427]|nr:hypothetical protein FRB90_005619 [Tulasnella sp. 427]